MSQAGLVARLAWRELWITFRMLLVLVAFVGVGAVVVLMPGSPGAIFERAAIGFGAATIVVAAVTAWSAADERLSGRTGWLVTRSVSRGTYLLGWFVALLSISVVGLVAAGFLGWMAAASGLGPPEPVELAAAVGAVAAAVAAAVALGLLASTLARPLPAAILAALGCLVVAALALASPDVAMLLPQAVLAEVAAPGSVLDDGMRSAGLALIACALLLSLARLAVERVEL
ncbi:MAG TPA: hypothetical protein VJ975_02230 [Candidatus Limnocylindria bacterium]|nr:hypothetical protein [Candidatus Limnocylindria bacterium]